MDKRIRRVNPILCKGCETIPKIGKRSYCHSCENIRARKIYSENPERGRENNNKWYDKRRYEMLSHYGLECACCGESKYRFLTIDHIEGGGTVHRKEMKGKTHIERWLRKNSYPEGFRTLCYNCNCTKGFFGVCPHQVEREGRPWQI